MQHLIGKHRGRDFVVIGAGRTVKDFAPKIKKLIKSHNCVTIGINNIGEVFVPNYHIWTNTGRYKEFGGHISLDSHLILGSHMKDRVKKLYNYDYSIVQYTDVAGEHCEYKEGTIHGFYRTAGNLAIMVAGLLGARRIFCVGFDGYGLYYRGNQHCYGSGRTDDYSDEQNKEKDRVIYKALRGIYKTVKFRIVTPTMYKAFQDLKVLEK